MERTFSIIKPDATARNMMGNIMAMIEATGLKVIAAKKIHLTPEQAGEFYAVHKERPFFDGLVKFMCSGPILTMVLEGDDAVAKYRKVMGATNPKDADENTIRKNYAVDIEANSVHGSDSLENAKTEIAFFFKPNEIVG